MQTKTLARKPRAPRPAHHAATPRSGHAVAKWMRDFDVRLERAKRQADQTLAELQAMVRKHP